MKLNVDQIREIACGAVRVRQEGETIRLYRFTEEQEALYRTAHPGLLQKTFSTAGIRLAFETDAQTLFLRVRTQPGSSRTYFSHEVFADGKRVGTLDNFSLGALPDNPKADFPLGEFEKSFALGGGTKQVCIYFPWSVASEIAELSLGGGAVVRPVKRGKKLLAFGDSITHGYDAAHPSLSYAARLADALGADGFNKAIGAEVFFPELAAARETFTPDYITVAYGTNDWAKTGVGVFCRSCEAFFAALCESYPQARIFAVAPIWRGDLDMPTEFGDFFEVGRIIRQTAEKYENVRFIDGYSFVPHSPDYFADRRLHPNEAGFACYFEALYAQMRELL